MARFTTYVHTACCKKTRLWQVAWILTADWIRLRRSHMTSLLKIILLRSWPCECEDACHPWVCTSIYSSRSIYHLTILDLRARTNYKEDILLKVWCWPLIGNHRRIRISCGTGSLRVASQGLSCPFLKTFAAVFSDPIDRLWISEDVWKWWIDLVLLVVLVIDSKGLYCLVRSRIKGAVYNNFLLIVPNYNTLYTTTGESSAIWLA